MQSNGRKGFVRTLSSSTPLANPWLAEDILEKLDREGPATRESLDLYPDFGDRRTFAIESPTECAPLYSLINYPVPS